MLLDFFCHEKIKYIKAIPIVIGINGNMIAILCFLYSLKPNRIIEKNMIGYEIIAIKPRNVRKKYVGLSNMKIEAKAINGQNKIGYKLP